MSDLLRPFADLPARAKVMMIDAVRPLPFRPQGKGLARGLEAIDPPQGMLIAYSSAPGTGRARTAPAVTAPMPPRSPRCCARRGPISTPRSRISAAAPISPPRDSRRRGTSRRSVNRSSSCRRRRRPQACRRRPPIRQARPMRDIGPDEAYALAIEMDTLEGYTGFVQAYPGHPYTQRVWAMIRARREALAWMRALEFNTPQSYWTYLRRYPNGMYAFDAERRLRRLGSPFAPPPDFAMMEFDDVPMALVDEPRDYVDVYRVGPPPPRGLYGAPRPAYLANLPPPQRRGGGPGSRILPALAVGDPADGRAGARAAACAAAGCTRPRVGRLRTARRKSKPRRVLRLPASLRTAAVRRTPPSRRARSLRPRAPHAVSWRQPSAGRGPGAGRPTAAGRRRPYAGNRSTQQCRDCAERGRAKSCCAGSATPGGPPPPSRPCARPAAGWWAASGRCEPDAACVTWSARGCCSQCGNPERGWPPPRQQPPAGAGRPPGGGSSPGIVNRTPPSGPPPQSASPPRGLLDHRRRQTGHRRR